MRLQLTEQMRVERIELTAAQVQEAVAEWINRQGIRNYVNNPASEVIQVQAGDVEIKYDGPHDYEQDRDFSGVSIAVPAL